MSAQDGDQPTAGARPLVLLEVFDGQKSFDEWVSHFENVSAVNGWNDDNKLLWLKAGKAHVVFTQLAHETQRSYETSKKALIDRFDLPSKQRLYKVEFEARAKRDKETWADFADELLCTYQLKAPSPPPGAHGVSGWDLSSSKCTTPHLWGITFEANPYTRPCFLPTLTSYETHRCLSQSSSVVLSLSAMPLAVP